MLFCTEKFLAMGEIFQKPSDGKRSSFSVAQGKDDIPMEGGNGFSCRHLIGNPLQNQTGQKADSKTAFHNGENGVIIPSNKTDIGRKTFSAEKIGNFGIFVLLQHQKRLFAEGIKKDALRLR